MFLIIILLLLFSQLCLSENLDKKVSFEIFHNYSEKLSKFQRIDTKKITIDVNGQQFEYFSSSIKEFKAKFYSNQTGVSLKFNTVDEKILYRFSIAVLTSSKMNFEEAEDFCSTKMGVEGEFSFFYSIFPKTIVSPSVDVVTGISWISCDFDNINKEENILRVDFIYKVLGYWLGLKIEKKFSIFEIFLSPNIFYRKTSLTNKTNFYSVDGENTIFNFSIGSKFYFTKKDSIGVEINRSIDFTEDYDFYTKIFLNIVF